MTEAVPRQGVLSTVRDRAGALVFRSSSIVWVGTALLIIVIKNGVWSRPNIAGVADLAGHFPHSTNPGFDYLLGSPLDLGLAHALGWTTVTLYFLLHLVALTAFIGILAAGAYRKPGRFGLGVAMVVLLASPLSNIEFTNIGNNDPFTLLFLTLAVVADESLPLAAIAGVGLGLSHAEIGAFALLAITLLRHVTGWRSANLATTYIGLIAGASATVAIDIIAGVGPDPRSTYIATVGLGNLADAWVAGFPTLAFSCFGALWVTIILLRPEWAPTRRIALVGAAIAVAALAISVTTFDESRIFALLVWAPVLWIILNLRREGDVEDAITWTFLAAVALPSVVVWEGTASVSTLLHLTGSLF